jgi:hypothetical protein
MSDFTAMSKAELRAYIVAHPKDDIAFDVFVDRFSINAPPTEVYGFPKSMDDIKHMEEIFRKKLQPPEE